MVNLSKSKYVSLWKCPKKLWLNKYKSEEAIISNSDKERMSVGNDVGDLAMGLFGDYVEVTVKNGDKLDLPKMVERTKEELNKGTDIICEASFSYNGLYCAVDILKKNGDCYDIYEIKSSTGVQDYYLADVTYQKYVLIHCGIKVGKIFVVTLNNEYIKHGDLEINKLFIIHDVTNMLTNEELAIENNLKLAEEISNSKDEPKYDLSCERCGKEESCEYWNYCAKDLPKHSIFDLYRMNINKKYDFYRKGIISYNDIINSGIELNEKQMKQVEYTVKDIKEPYIEKNNIRDFLSTLSYPLYFLDFETIQPAVPLYDGTKPYQQIPFQYSLHYIEKENGELKHKEFLAESGKNPLRDIAESLCRDIPMNVCVTAYNKGFECGRTQELAEMFPDLSKHLINIKENIKDFLIPFQSGYYYNKEMGGSFSIKSVLPALFPNDPKLDYHNLKGIVHNGGEAMTIFPQIQYMSKEEQEKARESLLKYCELDTYAMVKVWEKLKEASK